MRPSLVFSVTVAIAGAPLAVLAILVIDGDAAPWPALAGMAVTLAAALALALLWVADLSLLARSLRLAATGDDDAHALVAAAPRLAPTEAVTREIARVSYAVAERARLVERLLRSEAAIVECLPDPLVVLDMAQAIRRANGAARSTYGADLASVLRHPDLRGAIERTLADGGSPQTVALRLPVPVTREVQATVIRLDPPLAGGGQVLLVLSDRSRERAIEQMRADFVANASHELRTPLASLIGFIDTLRGPAAEDRPAQERFLAIMAEQGQRMNRLIDDLLSLSRIELTEHVPPAGRVELPGLLTRLAAAFEPRLAVRRMTLRQNVEDGLPAVVGDGDQLWQVLQNLLDNAVKYGREGGELRVSLHVKSGGRWPQQSGVVMAVADDGPGVAREHIPRLTERFYRADKGRARSIGGTGLGLAIVKHIVNRHRGRLAIESEPGRGATFSVWLPATPPI